MRLIDADVLKDAMYTETMLKDTDMQRWDSGCWIRYKLFENVLKEQPTIDAEPVKHGHWVYEDGKMGFGIGAWCCSECGEENESLPFHKCKDPYAYAASKYCACCGARMYE